MSRELVERLRGQVCDALTDGGLLDVDLAQRTVEEAADLIERQDILIKEMAATLQNMALSLSNKDTEE